MPLIHNKSDKAFKQNVETEMKAHPGRRDQNLAIAYSVKRRGKKMASGGMAHCAHGGPAYCNAGCYDEGGEINEKLHPEHDVHQAEDSMKARAQSVAYEHAKEEPMPSEGNEAMSRGGRIKRMAEGGAIEDSRDAMKNAIQYEESADEPMNEGAQENPRDEMPNIENSNRSASEAIDYEEGVDEPMHEAANMPRKEMPHSMTSEMAEKEGDMEAEDEPMKMARGGMLHPKKMAKMIMMAAGGMINSKDSWDAGERRTNAIESNDGGPSDKEDIDVAWTTPHDDNLSSEGDYPLMEEEGYEEGHQAKMRRKGGLLERVMAKIHAR